jgi:hypothetical protein
MYKGFADYATVDGCLNYKEVVRVLWGYNDLMSNWFHCWAWVPSVHLAYVVHVYSGTENGVADVEGNIYAEAQMVVVVVNVEVERTEHWDKVHRAEREQQDLYMAEDNEVEAEA